MTSYWRWSILLGALLVVLLVGCSSGGSGPINQTRTTDELIGLGQNALESVTTNLMMNPTDANQSLRTARTYFDQALAQDANNPKAKFGSAMANTLLGFYDLLAVMPKGLDDVILNLMTQSRARDLDGLPLDLPLAMMKHAHQTTRSSAIQNTQLQIATRTIQNLGNVLPYYDDVETAVRGGADIRLRMYQGGQIRTLIFGVADIQLLSFFANLVQAGLNAGVAFNLDMPANTAVRPLPVDSNNNGMFDAEEYLIATPFLERLYANGMPGCLQYLRYAAVKAQQGASLTGHTSGDNALIDVSKPSNQELLRKLGTYAAGLTVATTTEVTTNTLFGDGVTRTINLPKLSTFTSVRNLLPSFQKSDLSATGIWPDPTFRGVITPGIPQGMVPITYTDIEHAF